MGGFSLLPVRFAVNTVAALAEPPTNDIAAMVQIAISPNIFVFIAAPQLWYSTGLPKID